MGPYGYVDKEGSRLNQSTSKYRRLVAFMLAIVCVFAMLVPAGVSAEAVKVKTWKELVAAVDAGRTEITLSKGFQQKEDTVGTELVLRGGATVTVCAADGAAAEIKASLTVRGEEGGGTLALQGIDLVALSDHPALYVLGESAKVEAGNLTGGKASVGTPTPALIAEGDAVVTVGTVTGTDVKNTSMGGIGILAIDSATVEAEAITAGSSAKGYGGTAVIAAGNASVTVNGNAQGGNGQIASGWATRAAGNATVTVLGTAADGTKVEGAKPVAVPEDANDLSALRYMLLRGDTDIALSQSFKYAESVISEKMFGREYWIAFGEEPVRIHRADKAKKNVSFSGTHRFISGSFEMDGIDLNSHGPALILSPEAGTVTWTGSITSSATDADTVRVEGGSLTVTGELAQKNGKGGGVLTVVGANAEATVNGNVTGAGLRDAVSVTGGKATILGNIDQKGKGGAALSVGTGATVTVTGNIANTTDGQNAVRVDGGSLSVEGKIDQKSQKGNTVLTVTGEGAAVTVTGDITGASATSGVVDITDGTVTLNGALRHKGTKSGTVLRITGKDTRVTVTGDIVTAAPQPAVTVTDAEANITGNITAKAGNALFANGQSIVRINGDLANNGTKPGDKQGYFPCVELAGNADCTIEGNILSQGGSAIFGDGLSRLSMTGNAVSEDNTAVEESGYADMTLNGTIRSGNDSCFAVILYGAGNVIVQTPPGAVSIGKWGSAGAGGSLVLSSKNLIDQLPESTPQTAVTASTPSAGESGVAASGKSTDSVFNNAGEEKTGASTANKGGNKQNDQQAVSQTGTMTLDNGQDIMTVDFDDFLNGLANGDWDWFFTDPFAAGSDQEAAQYWTADNGGSTYSIDMTAGDESPFTEGSTGTGGFSYPSIVEQQPVQTGTVRHYDQTQQIVDMMNNDRQSGNTWVLNENGERVEQGVLGELKVDDALTEVAMKRAEELAEQFSHTRPDGTYVFEESPAIKSENIAGLYQTPEEMYDALLEKDNSYDGQGHRRNILDPSASTVGIGYVTVDGRNYYTMEFGQEPIVQTPAEEETPSAETEQQEDASSGSGISITLDPSMYYYPGAVYEITETDPYGNVTVTQFVPNPVEEEP